MRAAVLIPAYEPDEKLISLVELLLSEGLTCVVVDDGSITEGARAVFSRLSILAEESDDLAGRGIMTVAGTAGGKMPEDSSIEEENRIKGRLVMLAHEENRGKGRALKTGISWLFERGFDAAVTADSDGQHSLKDILRISEEMEKRPDTLILGMRDVAQMPARSKAGNTLTRRLFKLLYGISLNDTQTGLRGIPLLTQEAVERLLALEGERYEYEMEMLIEANGIFAGGMYELPIETIYIDDNKGSHFHAVRDGSKVYKVLFKNLPGFLFASVLSFLMDYVLFNGLFYLVFMNAVPSTVLARIVSGLFNFEMNKRLAFKEHGKGYNIINYVKLAVLILLINMAFMHVLVDMLSLPAFLMKAVVEAVLYVLSFSVQQRMAGRK